VCCNGSVAVGTADDSPSGSELSVYCESTSSSPALTLVVTTVVYTLLSDIDSTRLRCVLMFTVHSPSLKLF